jgi:hypothetical protein
MLIFRLVQDYVWHRLRANNRHGIHSPFVYKLIDTVIYDYRDQKVYHEAGALRSGGGETDGLKPKVNQLLYRLTAYFNPAAIVEIGKGNSVTNFYLQKAAPEAVIYNIKNDGNIAGIANKPVDLILFNCVQLKNEILNYFELCLPKTHKDTVLVFTGIYRSREMKQAWIQIKANPQVTLTVDLFWIGFVFFKQGRSVKEHFRVKY